MPARRHELPLHCPRPACAPRCSAEWWGAAPAPQCRLGGRSRGTPAPCSKSSRPAGIAGEACRPASGAAGARRVRPARPRRSDRAARPDGSLAIIDYKTGTPPSQKRVDAGLAPQLAAGSRDGRGGRVRRGAARRRRRVDLLAPDRRLRPGRCASRCSQGKRGKRCPSPGCRWAQNPPRQTGLRALIARFDDEPNRRLTGRSRHPGRRKPRFSDYAQLARVAEWDLAGPKRKSYCWPPPRPSSRCSQSPREWRVKPCFPSPLEGFGCEADEGRGEAGAPNREFHPP